MTLPDGSPQEETTLKHKKKKRKDRDVSQEALDSAQNHSETSQRVKRDKKKKKQDSDKGHTEHEVASTSSQTNTVESLPPVVLHEQCDILCCEDSEKQKNRNKKKKKRKIVAEDGQDAPVTVKKQKMDNTVCKKKEDSCSDGYDISLSGGVNESAGKKKKKRKKSKFSEAESNDSENLETQNGATEVGNASEPGNITQTVPVVDSFSKKGKKKSKKRRENEDCDKTEKVICANVSLSERCTPLSSDFAGTQETTKARKKKEKSKDRKQARVGVELGNVNGDKPVENDYDYEVDKSVSESVDTEEISTKTKTKKKKRKTELNDDSNCASSMPDVKNKDNDDSSSACRNQLKVDEGSINEVVVSAKKKDKKKRKKLTQTSDELEKNVDSGLGHGQEKNPEGPTEEMSNVESRERKGMENCADESETLPTAGGQWQGSMFESRDRQNKFLRLLGGMKKTPEDARGKGLFSSQNKTKGKGLFGSLAGFSQQKSNVALSACAAASLNKSLEDDYNRALNLKLGAGRGAGLGFTPDPAEGKKFHIDTSAVKSKVFDD